MAAGKPPRGEKPPEKQGKDVKAPVEASAPEPEAPKVEVSAEEKAEKLEASVDESLLEELESDKKIPYQRFKEVNEKAKSLERQLKDVEASTQARLQREVEAAELRIAERLKRESEQTQEVTLDPYERETRVVKTELSKLNQELTMLKAQAAERKLNDDLSKLESKYPDADSLAVLGWYKTNPSADLEELMEKSHNQNIERVEKKTRELIERKKQRSKTALPTSEGGIRLKESDKPKTLAAAHKMVNRLFGG